MTVTETHGRDSRPMQMGLGRRGVRLWLVALAFLCALELLTHTGARNGFLASSRPEHSGFDPYPA